MSGAALDVLRNGSRPSTSFNVLWNVCLPEQLYRTAVPMRTNSAIPYIAPEPENISIEFHYPSVTRRIVGAMVALILTPICNLLLIGYVQRVVLVGQDRPSGFGQYLLMAASLPAGLFCAVIVFVFASFMRVFSSEQCRLSRLWCLGAMIFVLAAARCVPSAERHSSLLAFVAFSGISAIVPVFVGVYSARTRLGGTGDR